jgi:hypothetical protein
MRKKKKKRKKPPNPYKGLGSVLPRGLGSRSISYTGKGNDLGRPSLPRQEAQVTLALECIPSIEPLEGRWPTLRQRSRKLRPFWKRSALGDIRHEQAAQDDGFLLVGAPG